jgi:hypothetical protein
MESAGDFAKNVIKEKDKSNESRKYNMVNSFIKVLIIIFTAAFSVACGLLFVRFSIPIYFQFFSPIPASLHNFYISAGIFSFLLIVLDIIFFKTGKYNWCIWVSGTAVLLLGFGIPIFMLENNNMLWQQAVLAKSGPVYFIEFSEQNLYTLKYFQNLYVLIWSNVYLYVYVSIIIYLAGYFSLWRLGWRIKGVRIKL